MNTSILLLPFLTACILTPLVKWFAIQNGYYAQTNHRTVHKGKIPRIGGIGIYIAFMVSVLLCAEMNAKLWSILIGINIIFLTGLVDDLKDLKPKTKLLFQAAAALILVASGIRVDAIRLPMGICIEFGPLSILFTIVWIVGVTNAINLIDGLDGLCGGISAIILTIIGSMALIEGKNELAVFALLLAASAAGFLPYNMHPASIFMGDCGSLMLGFAIAALSLVGFKSSTVLTLALPMLILFLPITDTLSAILRRTLAHKRFSEADKSHLHHMLMKQFGHRNTVLIMWTITALFGLSAYLYLVDKGAGLLAMALIIFIVELFVERSEMISASWHPILYVLRQIRHYAGLDFISFWPLKKIGPQMDEEGENVSHETHNGPDSSQKQ